MTDKPAVWILDWGFHIGILVFVKRVPFTICPSPREAQFRCIHSLQLTFLSKSSDLWLCPICQYRCICCLICVFNFEIDCLCNCCESNHHARHVLHRAAGNIIYIATESFLRLSRLFNISICEKRRIAYSIVRQFRFHGRYSSGQSDHKEFSKAGGKISHRERAARSVCGTL